ncbi:MAG: ABC transporter ATP-binding protein [Desulfobacterales bacterium]|nr:ABC transporter ATP-binding protein [Desulfobacterales bacterium]
MELLNIEELTMHFQLDRGIIPRLLGRKPRMVHAVDGVSLGIKAGSCFGLVGESGCGKSTLGRSIFRLNQPQRGKIRFHGENILEFNPARMKAFRQKAQLIFQDPFSCLNPTMTAGEIIAEPLEVYGKMGDKKEEVGRVMELLEAVQLPGDALAKFPNEFSGGQARRIGVARAIALSPELIVADEPTSGLDISTTATILNLMQALQEKYRLTYVWISHNLDQIQYMCDAMAVMYLGKVVECGPTREIIRHRAHPYTQALLSAIPKIGRGRKFRQRKKILGGELPSPIAPPSGCRFRTRCPHAFDRCAKEEPRLLSVDGAHKTACHLLN